MSAGRSLLQGVAHCIAVLWIGAYLAWPGAEPRGDEATARVRPRPEAPPPVEAARAEPPPAESPPAERPRSEPTRVGSAQIATGAAFLDGAGDFPALTCSYEDFGSFRHYARAMLALGARFVVVRQREIVGAIHPETGAIEDVALESAFSPRARDYAGEPGLARAARAARERFGASAVVMMLVPRDIDAGLFGGIAHALSQRGDGHDRYQEIRGRYEPAADGVRLRVDGAVHSNGAQVPMDLVFDLGQIRRAARSSAGAA